MKYAALWLLDQGRSEAQVAKIHGVSRYAIQRWKKNKVKIRDKNRDDLVAHLTPKT
jgi:transposase